MTATSHAETTAGSGPPYAETEVSLFGIGAAMLRNLGRIAGWALAGGIVMAAVSLRKPALYSASFSFVPQSSAVISSGLASLAGQFGITTPGSSPTQSPDFYVALIQSRELLGRVVRDTLSVAEQGRRVAYVDLFEEPAGPQRYEVAVKDLGKMITAGVSLKTGVVQVSVSTRWPSVSLAIVRDLLDGVNDYNLRTRQSQAAGERKFIEGQLAGRRTELKAAEDRLQEFLNDNRGPLAAPSLQFERDRLQRDVAFQQQLVTALTQSFEDARIREVRDTPTITVFEGPAVSTMPVPRGRIKLTLLGVILGAMIAAFVVAAAELFARRAVEKDEELDAFLTALRDLRKRIPGFRPRAV